MDSSLTKSTFDHDSVQTSGVVSIKLLLQAGTTDRVRSVAHESSGRDLYGKALLWFSENGSDPSKRGAQRESQTNSKDHARAGTLWEPTRPQYLQTSSKTGKISLSSQRVCNLGTISSLEYRYQCAVAKRHKRWRKVLRSRFYRNRLQTTVSGTDQKSVL